MKKISEVKYGRKCIGFSVRGNSGMDECVLSLHPALVDYNKENPERADRYRPAASIVLKREQIIDLIVWLSDVLKVDYKKGEK